MGQYNQAVITTAGQGLLAGVIASGKALAFTNAKTSTHIYPSGLEALTDITDVMQTDAVSSATVMSNTQVKISTRFTNEGITAAYDINTIGIFAKAEGDATDTLFAVITAVTPDAMPKYTTTNPVAYIYDITVGMSNADSITLNVSPTGTPSYGDLAAAQTAAENASAANLAPAYDSTATYAKDDFCVQGGKLYQCNADISTAEAFNPAHWTEVKVTEVMGGGGGVTPEIEARIENAQWKTESTEQLFSETVTMGGETGTVAYLEYANLITADPLVVTFNGEEYICPRFDVGDGSYAYGGYGENGYDFSEYPFAIVSLEDEGNVFRTPDTGTYTISASVNTVTTTDTFKQAVNDIAGWKTTGEVGLFNESVTTVAGTGGNMAPLTYAEPITADTLKVTFNGVEYTCPKITMPRGVGYGAIGSTGFDFTEFPFMIWSGNEGNFLYTETPGTYTISASAKTTTYTDAFKNGVQLASVPHVVENSDNADYVVIDVSEDMEESGVEYIEISNTGTPAITFLTETRTLYAGKYILYRLADNGKFSNGNFDAGITSHGEWTITERGNVRFISGKCVIVPAKTYNPISSTFVTFYSNGLLDEIDSNESET